MCSRDRPTDGVICKDVAFWSTESYLKKSNGLSNLSIYSIQNDTYRQLNLQNIYSNTFII